ncbi:MAG: TldD/PmbA family protein [Gaiellales bacterium]|nr:MAG: TldD/PmbA family protein [Gaiellales bacterium]
MIEEQLAHDVLEEALTRGGDFADLYVERRKTVALNLEDGRLERSSTGFDLGASVRVFSGRNISFVSTDSIDEGSLREAARLAGEGSSDGGASVRRLEAVRGSSRHPVEEPPAQTPAADKAGLLAAADDAARAAGPEIVQASCNYSDVVSEVLVANSEGVLAADERTRVRMSVQVVGARGGITQTGFESVGAHRGMELFARNQAADIGEAAARKAITMLDSRPAPSGKMPVVLHRGFGGVLFHEACGHGLEADAIEKGASVFRDKLGHKVASGLVTLIDDGSVPNAWGSGAVDDEGVPTRRNVLIDAGELTGFLYDRLRARNAGAQPTGNGRRQSYRHTPIPRMTNTFITGGDAPVDEIFAATDRGFFAKTLAGGQVDPATGDFVFGVSEGYLIEKGRVTTPLRGATLIGNGLVALNNIDLVADDFEMHIGVCGKDGQGVPVGSGQPTLRILDLTIGGTEVG